MFPAWTKSWISTCPEYPNHFMYLQCSGKMNNHVSLSLFWHVIAVQVMSFLTLIACCYECIISQASSESHQQCLRNQTNMQRIEKQTEDESAHNPSENYWEMREASSFSKPIFGTQMYTKVWNRLSQKLDSAQSDGWDDYSLGWYFKLWGCRKSSL